MKTLFTDLGDVMFLGDHEGLKQAVIRRTGFLPDAFHGRNSRTFFLGQRGRISKSEILKRRAEEIGIDPKTLLELFAQLYVPNEPYLEFLREWKASGRKIFLISNIDTIFWDFFKAHPIFNIFNGLFLSYRLRVVKPDRRIFERCIQEAGACPSDSFFVDDIQENIVSASRIGFNAWHYHKSHHTSFAAFMQSILYEKEGRIP